MDNKYEWLNEDSRTFLSRGYLVNGTTPEERIKEIADYSESLLGISGFADKFEDYMSKGWYSLSTPVWTNFGLGRGLGVSCFGVDIQDDMADILRSAAEIGMLSKNGGGTAGFFGNLRPRGSVIKDNGVSSGAPHFMEIFQAVSNTVNQGSSRRGHFAAYLPIEHQDYYEFMQSKSEGNPIQDISIAITVSDEFMEKLVNRDAEAEEKWVKLIQKRFETGYPYVMFTGNSNRNRPKAYIDKGLYIKQSQMCVTGDQRVVTNMGMLTASELYNIGGNLTLFDNLNVVKSSPMMLIAKDEDVYEILLDNGLAHKVTGYHKLSKLISFKSKVSFEDTMCSDLVVGDKIAIQTNKGLFGSVSMEDEAFLLGLYQADGTQNTSSVHFDIWENDFDLIQEVEAIISRLHLKYDYVPRYSTKGDRFIDCNTGPSKVKKKRLTTQMFSDLEFKKGIIPSWIWKSNENTIWAYIKGLLYADGTAYLAGKNSVKVDLSNISKNFLKDLQLLFNNLGLRSSINLLRLGGESLLPNGKGGNSLYKTKNCYRLSVNNKLGLQQIESNTKFLSRKGIDIFKYAIGKNSRKTARIVSIEHVGKDDVYCVQVESDRHHWVCNGVITHNCSEIIEYTGPDKSFTCCLSSMNLLHYDDWKGTDAVEVLTYFLDSVLTDFINRASKIPFMEKVVKFAVEHRSIGLGVLGYHSYLQSKNIAFESMSARSMNKMMFKLIDDKSLKASKELASMYGEPEILKGYGERFSTRIAIAPTTSSSFILKQVSPSIEPLNSNYFLKDLAKGKFVYRNPYLDKLLTEKGKNSDFTWSSILTHGGSVQHLSFLTDDEKAVFKTFGEISQLEVVTQAADRQKYIDQSQSLNLMIHPSTPVYEVHALMLEAWKLGIKTLYYQRSANLAQEVGRELMNCSMCEG